MGSNGTAGREKHNGRPRRESFAKRKPRLARAVFSRDGYRCIYCGVGDYQCPYCGVGNGGVVKERLTIDHVVPRSRGGKDEAANLVTACMGCNCSRQNRTLAEWSRVLGQRLGLAPRTVARRVRRQLHKPVIC